MIKILFVCHGNICRSPMAEYIFKDLLKKYGLEDVFETDSAGTSNEELGNPVYPPAKRVLAQHGITDTPHRARRMTKEDYRHFDYIYVMDAWNEKNALRMTSGDPEGKIKLLYKREIEDPWYTGGFDRVYTQIEEGCIKVLESLFSFYGADGLNTDRKIMRTYALLFSAWCPETCAPRMREKWTLANRTLGQCSITSFLVQDTLGGSVLGSFLESGNLHCFNLIDGRIYDFTSAQIENAGEYCSYSSGKPQSREFHFANEEKKERYELLKKRFTAR